MLASLPMAGRYLAGMRRFLRDPISPVEARRRVERGLAAREASFLAIVERGILAWPRSPYARLLSHAGVEGGDVAALVRRDGVEGALAALHAAGVRVSLDEFKGRRPIRRGSLEFATRPSDFDNPLSATAYAARTGGSRGAGQRVLVDFDLLAHDAALHGLFLEAFGLGDRPFGLWRPVPPAIAGLANVFRHAKLGKGVDRWFAQNAWNPRRDGVAPWVATMATVAIGRATGHAIAAPEHVPVERADRVAAWLAATRAAGRPALLDTVASAMVRVCRAAGDRGLDISGTVFRYGGEPCTPARARVVAEAGCRALSRYNMAELGIIGLACASPDAFDEVHLASEKLAVILHGRDFGGDGPSVHALSFTTLLPASPKLMLNVESGDYATLSRRACDCLLGEVGLTTHLHAIGSWEKLTSEGMTFLGNDLARLVDDVLPSRFGGGPTDYQLVEEELDALPRVSVVVSPRLGAIDESALVDLVVASLGARSGAEGMMADRWRDASTLRVVRREPYATSAAKILPLHVVRGNPPTAVGGIP